MVSIIIYLLVKYQANGIHLQVLNLSDIYEVRKEIVYPYAILRYFVVWQYRFIAPYLLLYYFKKKRYSYILLIIIMQSILYLILPRKEILFSAFLIAVL